MVREPQTIKINVKIRRGKHCRKYSVHVTIVNEKRGSDIEREQGEVYIGRLGESKGKR